MKGFTLESITIKGRRCVHYYFKQLAYKKRKISDLPLKIEFLFVREKELANIKHKDLWFISKMLDMSHRVKKDIDYKLEAIE